MNPNSDNMHYDHMQIINMVARMYDPILGQFISVDPLYAKYPGISAYVYCMNNPIEYWDPTGEEVYYSKNGKRVIHDTGENDNQKFIVTDRKQFKKDTKANGYNNFNSGTVPVMSSRMAEKMNEAHNLTKTDGNERLAVQDKDGNPSRVVTGSQGNVNAAEAYKDVGGVGNATMEAHTHEPFTLEGNYAELKASKSNDGSDGGDVTNHTGIPSAIVGTEWQKKEVFERTVDEMSGVETRASTPTIVPDPVTTIISYDQEGNTIGSMNWEKYLESIGNIN